MLYGADTKITDISPGSHIFKVLLNTADHRNYVHHAEPIADEMRVVVN